MDYKNKYLKYKNKYYNLVIAKKMKGGDPLLHIPLGVAITGILSYIINWYICNDSKNENKISDIETDIKALSDENSKILETLGLMEKTDLVNILEIIQAMLRDEPVLKEKIISDYEKTGNTEQTVLKLLDNSDALHEAIQKLKEQKELSDHKVAELEQTLQEQREELEQEKTTGIEALSTLEEQHHRERAEQELEHKQSIKSIHEILKKNLDALVKTHQEDLKTLEEEAERVNKAHSTIKEDCANEECTSNLKAQLQAKEKEIKYLELERTNKEREHNESLAVTLGELRRLETELTRQKTMCDASNECLDVVEDNLVKVIQDKENIEEMLTKSLEEEMKKKKDRESELAERESELAERESELAKMKTNLKDLEKAHEEDIKTATEQTTHAVRAELTEQIKILTNELDEINNEKNDLERESNALKEEKKKSEVEIITLHETLKDLEGQHDISLDEILDSHNLMKEDELSNMSAAEIARLSKPLSKEATEAIDARPQNVDKEGEWWNKLTQGVQNELIEHAHSPEWRLPGAGEEEHNMDTAWDRRFGEAESNIRNLGHTIKEFEDHSKEVEEYADDDDKEESPMPTVKEMIPEEQDPTWLSALDPDSVVSQEDKEAYKEMKDRRSPSSQSDRVPRQAKDYERQHKIREREREREAREGMKTPYDTDPTIGPVQGQGREKATQIEGLTNKGHTRGELAHPQRRQDMLQRLAYGPAQKIEEEKMEEERAWEKGVQPGRRVADGIRKGNELDEDDQVMMAELSGESYTLKGKVGGGNKKVSNPLNDLIKVLVNNINYTNGIKLFDYNKKILKRINKKLDRKVVDNKYIDKMKLFSNKIFKILSNEKLSNNEKNMKVRKYLTKEYNATIN